VTYFSAHYQRGEKIHKELLRNPLKNPLLTGEDNIFVRIPRMRISFSSKLYGRKLRNDTQTSFHHKMTQEENTKK